MKEVIDKMKADLTGDSETDVKYLLAKLDVYKQNPEVVKAIYRMLFDTLSDEEKDGFFARINSNKFGERIQYAYDLLVGKKYESALKMLDGAIDYIKEVYEDDENVYKTFHDKFEAILYAVLNDNPTKKIKASKLDFGTYYKFQGIAYNNLKKYNEALECLEKSLKWNPVDFEAIFEYEAALLNLGMYEDLRIHALQTLKKAYTNYAIAMCYHNLGLYYMAKNTKADDDLAFNLICYSISFTETEYAYRDLNIIAEKYRRPKELNKTNEVLKALEKHDIPKAPDLDLVKTLVELGVNYIDKDNRLALKIFKVIYALSHDDNSLGFIKMLEEKIKASKK